MARGHGKPEISLLDCMYAGKVSTTNSSMVILTTKLQEQLASQNIRHDQAMTKMLYKITALQWGGGGGGTWECRVDWKPTPNNTNKTKGWKGYSNKDRPSHHTREKTNLGDYCWLHEVDPWGLGISSKKCK